MSVDDGFIRALARCRRVAMVECKDCGCKFDPQHQGVVSKGETVTVAFCKDCCMKEE